jgi:hypothetical protein
MDEGALCLSISHRLVTATDPSLEHYTEEMKEEGGREAGNISHC